LNRFANKAESEGKQQACQRVLEAFGRKWRAAVGRVVRSGAGVMNNQAVLMADPNSSARSGE